MKIILASGSPRRKELLAQAGYDFVIEVSDADENIQAENPGELVEELSCRKAQAVAHNHRNTEEICTIIGADTVVALEGKILGKPENEGAAMQMLRSLSGKTHQVYTGVSLLLLQNGQPITEEKFHVCTDVTMRKITEEELIQYVNTGEPMDKAGAYGIQGKAAMFISGICGDYYNVVGLPLCETVSRLRQLWKEWETHEKILEN